MYGHSSDTVIFNNWHGYLAYCMRRATIPIKTKKEGVLIPPSFPLVILLYTVT